MTQKFYSFVLFAFLTSTLFSQMAMDTVKGQYAQINDVKIHYKIYGKGSDVLFLLHGSLECMTEWEKTDS